MNTENLVSPLCILLFLSPCRFLNFAFPIHECIINSHSEIISMFISRPAAGTWQDNQPPQPEKLCSCSSSSIFSKCIYKCTHTVNTHIHICAPERGNNTKKIPSTTGESTFPCFLNQDQFDTCLLHRVATMEFTDTHTDPASRCSWGLDARRRRRRSSKKVARRVQGSLLPSPPPPHQDN